MTFWPSPSKFALFDACAFPWATNSPARVKQAKSKSAAFGIAVSRASECLSVLGSNPAATAKHAAELEALTPSETTKLVLIAEHIARDLDATDHYRSAEVGVVYNPYTGVAKQCAREDTYAPPSSHFGGALDLLAVDKGGRTWVRDYKSGRRQALESSIKSDPQVRAYALFAARMLGIDEVWIELGHVDEDGVTHDAARLDSIDLGIISVEVKRRAVRLEAQRETPILPTPGAHCNRAHCPIVSVCPETIKAMAAIDAVVEEHNSFPLTPTITSPEHGASVIRRLRMIEAAMPTIRAGVDTYVKEKSVTLDLGGGVFYGLKEEKGKDRIDLEKPGAIEAVRNVLGDAADFAIEMSTSKAAILRGARERVKRDGAGTFADLSRAALADLNAIGAIRQGAPVQRFTDFKKAEVTQ